MPDGGHGSGSRRGSRWSCWRGRGTQRPARRVRRRRQPRSAPAVPHRARSRGDAAAARPAWRVGPCAGERGPGRRRRVRRHGGGAARAACRAGRQPGN